jgi:hypothetical protein
VSARTTRIYQIGELIVRFEAEQDETTGKWHVRDKTAGKRVQAEYGDQRQAIGGAHMAAACAIDEEIIDPLLAGR